MGGGPASRSIHMQMVGRDTGTASQERETWKSGSIPDLWDHREPEGHREPPPSPPTECGTQMPRDGRARPGQAQLVTHCLFLTVELGGVLPGVLGYHSHSRLTPAILCLGLSGQLQAGEGWELLCSSRGRPNLPPLPGTGHLLAHLPSPTASVCTWTVKSCLELPWNTEV